MPDETVPVSLNFEQATQVSEREWELPPWHSLWGRVVHPLMIATTEACLFPLGTAFGFSSLNHILTARHSIEGGLKQHHPRRDEFARKGLRAALRNGNLDHTQLAIVSQGPNPRRGDVSFDVRAISSIHAALPTDLVIGNILHDESALVPTLEPTITFAPPRVGETVRCVGYCDSEVPTEGLSVDQIRAGNIDPYDHFRHRLLVVEGKVKHFFLDGLSSGFAEGPCFTIDAEVPHGLSGGPIFNSSGAICGAVYSGASMFFEQPTTVGALFYPIFLLRLSFGVSMAGGKFKFTATDRPVAELVASQAIRTDGAEEEQLHFKHEEEGVRIGPGFEKEDMSSIYQNFAAYQDGTPIEPLEDQDLRTVKPNLENPFIKSRRGGGGEGDES